MQMLTMKGDPPQRQLARTWKVLAIGTSAGCLSPHVDPLDNPVVPGGAPRLDRRTTSRWTEQPYLDHDKELRAAYEAAYPRECCGVFLGSSDGAHVSVERVVSTLNAAGMAGGFAIPDDEMRRVRRVAARLGLAIVAVFHSHPSGCAELSNTDRAALRHSEWPWVVVTENRTSQELLLTWWAGQMHH